MPYPAGNIAVVDARLQDISGSMQWNMQDAEDIRFLAVSGTITVGASRARYDFTLVEYHLHIDEVPWLIFSTLNNALELEFTAEFWDIVNKNRKERWGFLEVPWIAGKEVYDVAAPYPEVRMSIFNNRAHTIRVVRPFVWKDTYLKVHPNGAAVFAEDKKLAFFLPLTCLLPSVDHWSTWIAPDYPPQPARPKQPPQPPRPTRWQERAERPKEKADTQASQGSTSQDPQASKPSPQQLAEHEKRYMELQAIVASLGQRTLAESRPTANQPGQEPDKTPVQPAPQQVDAGAHLQSGIIDNGTAKDPTTHNSSQPQTTKVSAQTLAEARPEPPPPPSTKEPKEDAPGTGELSAHAPDHLGANKPTQPKQKQQPTVEFTVGASPILSPTESSDTLASETVVVSSPAPDQEEDINAMDFATLQKSPNCSPGERAGTDSTTSQSPRLRKSYNQETQNDARVPRAAHTTRISRWGHRNGRDGLSGPRADHHHVHRTFMVQLVVGSASLYSCCRWVQKKTTRAVTLCPPEICGR